MYRVISVRRAEDTHVALCSGNSELPGPCYATGWAEKLRPRSDIDCFLSLLQVVAKDGIRVAQNRSIHEIMVTDFVSACLNSGNYLWVPQSTLADEKEGGVGIVLLEDIKHLWSERGVRAIINRKANQWTSGPKPIDNVGRDSLEHTQDIERLYPKRHTGTPERESRILRIFLTFKVAAAVARSNIPAKQTPSMRHLVG